MAENQDPYFDPSTGEWKGGESNVQFDSSGNQFVHTHENEFADDYFVVDNWWEKDENWKQKLFQH